MAQDPPAILISSDDESSDPTWTETDWINCGKTYPTSNIPASVIQRRKTLLQIPQMYAKSIPAPQASIASLISTTRLPLQSRTLTPYTANVLFSAEVSNEAFGVFSEWDIPPLSFVLELETAFGQAWFDGANSIRSRNQKGSYLPFYAISYWRTMHRVLDSKSAWDKARLWIERGARLPSELPHVEAALTMMQTLSWGISLSVANIGCLPRDLAATLLGEGHWLNDDTIDLLVTHLCVRLRDKPPASPTSGKYPI